MLPALIAAAVLLPFIQSHRTVDVDLVPKFLGLAILVATLQAGFCLRRTQSGFTAASVHLIAWIFAGYAVANLAAVSVAINPLETVFETVKTFLLAVLLLQASILMAESGAVRTRGLLSKAIILFGIAVSTMGLVESAVQLKEGHALNVLYKVTGTLGHKNLLSAILLFSLPFSLFGILRFRGSWRIASWASLVQGMVVIAILETRSVWAALAVAAIGGSILSLAPDLAPTGDRGPKGAGGQPAGGRKRPPWRGKAFWVIGFGAILVLGLGLAARFEASERLRDRVASIFDPSQNQWRLLTWQKSVQMLMDHKWLGVGPGNWKINFLAYETDNIRVVGGQTGEDETAFVRPHNDFLWAFCETGMAGGILYLGFFLGLLFLCVRRRLRSCDTEEKAYALCLFMGISGYMVDACFSFPRERIAHSVFLILAAASLLIPERAAGAFHVPDTLLRKTTRWAALALMAPVLIYGWIRLDSEIHIRKALEARAAERWEEVVTEISAVNERIYPLDPLVNPATFYRGTAYYLLGDRVRAQADFESALKRHPFHVHSLNNLGTCMQLSGHPEKALELYHRAVSLRPSMAEAWLNGAAVQYNLGRYQDSREWLSKTPSQPSNPRWEYLTKQLGEISEYMEEKE